MKKRNEHPVPFVGWAGAGGVRPWALSPAQGSAAQRPLAPRPRPSGLLVVEWNHLSPAPRTVTMAAAAP